MKSFLKILSIILILDFIFSSLLFKKTDFWQHKDLDNKYWRIQSNIYHHDLMPNIDAFENWGGKLQKKIITNSLGFRDYENRFIEKKPTKERILLVGDSFIEGAGYNYEHTIGGLLQNKFKKKYEILNSAVGSYSPSIYYKKLSHFISEGYSFDHAVVFLDVSDIFDELFIKFDDNGNIVTENEAKNTSEYKKKIYILGKYLRDNTITFRFFIFCQIKQKFIKIILNLNIKVQKI
jgi:hypothetical protein